jgi:hypothetical protein
MPLMLTEQLLTQSQNMVKTTGPSANSSFSISNNQGYTYGYLVFWPTGSKQHPGFQLIYQFNGSYCDWYGCAYTTETFNGPIPVSSITFSGEPQWNGSYQVVLDVDTSLIPDGGTVMKTGTGGHIALTWDQNPTASVQTQIGTIGYEDLSGRSRSNGWNATMGATATGSVWAMDFGLSWNDPNASMNWWQLTGN